MDLTQSKLTKAEWQSVEIPVCAEERTIAEMICKGFHDVNHHHNPSSSLMSHVKITPSPDVHQQLYVTYFQEHIRGLVKKYGLNAAPRAAKGCKVKSADRIRIEHTESTLMQQKDNIFEFIVLELVTSMLRSYKKGRKDWLHHFYTCAKLVKYRVAEKNPHVVEFVEDVIKTYREHVDLYDILRDAKNLIEENKSLLRHADIALYSHQKELFTVAKRDGPKLVLYTAPTGTGKTLSPLGLSEKYAVIFVCAARHVGLALAKNAISCDKKVAFAFGCSDASNIRLHYFAAKEYTRHRRSGAIHKVDNAVGDKVEIMICDVQSYVYAMHYMCAFNELENLIMYWDEPTITLDYSDHDLHETMARNWDENVIPNVVLSSATLPREDEIRPVAEKFKDKFPTAEVVSIVSHDCKKTISVLTKENCIALPHLRYESYEDVLKSVEHCRSCRTLLRYFDLGGAIAFIDHVNTNSLYASSRYGWERAFPTIDDITMDNIKLYYLDLLGHLNEDAWPSVRDHCVRATKPRYASSVHLTTSDAHTLTDGPTIFLTDNVDKIARFYLKDSKIPAGAIKESYEAISFNNIVTQRMDKLEKDIEDARAKDEEKDRKQAESRVPPEVKEMMRQLDELRRQIKTVSLHDMFVPNKRAHIDKWGAAAGGGSPYTSDITEHTVSKIMQLHGVEDTWKMLLLMGVGVFTRHESTAYMEIMKELAGSQKLYLIIASSDFVYGTNYQFCHGYVSQDLRGMTQEKMIQALGRIGRRNVQQSYSVRLRSNDMLDTLFMPQSNKPEIANMNRLFG